MNQSDKNNSKPEMNITCSIFYLTWEEKKMMIRCGK